MLHTKIMKHLKYLGGGGYAPADTIEDYFAMPREKREKWGFWYLYPRALPMTSVREIFDDKSESGWNSFKRLMIEQYPIQGFLREVLWETIDSYFSLWHRIYQEKFCWPIYYWFKPCNPTIQKALPQGYADVSELIRELNFACIEQFYHESEKGWVDWESQEWDKKFKNELDDAYNYIKVRRPSYQEKLDNSYPSNEDYFKIEKNELTADQTYAKLRHWEELISDCDEKYIIWAVKNRNRFWT